MRTPDIRRQKSQPMAPKRLNSEAGDAALLQSPLWPLRAVMGNLNQPHSCLPAQRCSLAQEAHSKPGRKDSGSLAHAALAPRDQSGTCGELAVAHSQLLQGQGVQSPTCNHNIFLANEEHRVALAPFSLTHINTLVSKLSSMPFREGTLPSLKPPVHPQTLYSIGSREWV